MTAALPPIYPEIVAWQKARLPDWYRATVVGDNQSRDLIEEELVGLATRVDERVRTLTASMTRSKGLFPDDWDDDIEPALQDINKCLCNMQSLRPQNQKCPVRSLSASAISRLRSSGGLRHSAWAR
ncbi:hypothetical protein [Fuerstiella marisgermanici]|uniref:Uncharacterized protein n=1 Tax=Fuerstiella marisgermanici TaxID=1891926 RepID=A0A1P8WKF7_9PLAN|nr:hypothetical protein [Fuerstiella marisgermanici]APZ94536.1 hypothetical protein Fuma_04168 [Fuerstiella marisgermanici]